MDRFDCICICIVVRDPVIKREDLINWFNPAIFLYMSQAMTWISLKRHISFSLFLCVQ